MTQEEFNGLTLEQQIEALKTISVVGVPTCGCTCGQHNGGTSGGGDSAQHAEPDPALAANAFAGLRWRSTRVTLETIRQSATVWAATNPFAHVENGASIYENYLYWNRDTFTQVGFTGDQMLFIALLIDAERRRTDALLEALTTRVRALELRVEAEHPGSTPVGD